jgi:hypothetical protein
MGKRKLFIGILVLVFGLTLFFTPSVMAENYKLKIQTAVPSASVYFQLI